MLVLFEFECHSSSLILATALLPVGTVQSRSPPRLRWTRTAFFTCELWCFILNRDIFRFNETVTLILIVKIGFLDYSRIHFVKFMCKSVSFKCQWSKLTRACVCSLLLGLNYYWIQSFIWCIIVRKYAIMALRSQTFSGGRFETGSKVRVLLLKPDQFVNKHVLKELKVLPSYRHYFQYNFWQILILLKLLPS